MNKLSFVNWQVQLEVYGTLCLLLTVVPALARGEPNSCKLTTHQSVGQQLRHNRVQLFDYWATTCGACRPGLTALQVLHIRFPVVAFLSFAMDDPATIARVEPVARQAGVTFPIISGSAAQRLASKYNVQTYPALFLLDQQGHVVWSHSGALDAVVEKKLTHKITSLLSSASS